MKWHFIDLNSHEYNINTVNEKALGGIESSICYLMNALNLLNEKVNFWSKYNSDKIINNIEHHKLSEPDQLKKINGDVVVYIGHPSNLINLKENIVKNVPILFWAHHNYDQEIILDLKYKNINKNIDAIIYISEWQKINYIKYFDIGNIPSYCIGHGITPEFCNMFSSINDFKKLKEKSLGIYSSTPFRGLDKLYLSSNYINEEIVIDIYSSMKIYNQDFEDKKYYELYKKISESKKFKYFGSVNKKELSKAYSNKSFLLYPSIFEETFCITLLDALAAGLEPIITNIGALPETSNGFGKLLNITDNFAKEYAGIIDESIKNKKLNFEKWCEKQYKQILFINEKYTWTKRAQDWIKTVKKLDQKNNLTMINENKKYLIITDYIKDLSFEIPSSESYVDAAQNLDKYEAKIDISNKPLKNGMIELNCKVFFEAPQDITNKIYAEISMAIIFKIVDTKLEHEKIKKIILAEIPDLYGEKITDLITNLFHQSGFKEFKFKKRINFTELYEQQFSNLKQKN